MKIKQFFVFIVIYAGLFIFRHVLSFIALIHLIYSQPIRYFMPKRPVENDPSGLYYQNRFGVYIGIPCSSGFISLEDLGLDRPSVKKTRGFSEYKQVIDADPQTFQILKGSSSSRSILGKDKNFVFYGGEVVPGGDVNSLQVFDTFARDRKYIYFGGYSITRLDVETFQHLVQTLVSDKNGLYAVYSAVPRKIDLIDRETFKGFSEIRFDNNRNYIGEDKNFNYYFAAKHEYLAEPKPGLENYKELGCGYFFFHDRIFHTVFQLTDADPATFRVLDSPNCRHLYAVDKNHRWHLTSRLSPNDINRNRRIDVLLAPPEERKKRSRVFLLGACITVPPDYKYEKAGNDANLPAGAIRMTQYLEADLVRSELLNSAGVWQVLPEFKQVEMLSSPCLSISVYKFRDYDKKHWFVRRDPSSFTLIIGSDDQIFVIADRNHSVKLAFTYRLIDEILEDKLKNTLIAYPSRFDMHPRSIFEDKLFLNKNGLPEIWIPLEVKDILKEEHEDVEFIHAGFVYRDQSWNCLDEQQCSRFGIPFSLGKMPFSN